MLTAWRYEATSGSCSSIDDLSQLASFGDDLAWIDASEVTAAELIELGGLLGVHDLAVEDLGKGGQRTKLEDYGDHWHIALYDCTMQGASLVANELDVLFGARWILIRHHGDSNPIVDEARRRFALPTDGGRSFDVGLALWAVLDVIVDRWFTVSDVTDDQLELIEDVVFDNQSDSIPQNVFELRRSLVSFRRVAGPTREVLAAVLRGEIPHVSAGSNRRLHDVNDHVLRIMELVESQRELLTALLEAQLATASNRMNQVMKATSSWGAILVLNTLIAGIYGMNFRHMPELAWRLGYPLSIFMMIVVTVGGYRLFKRRGWI